MIAIDFETADYRPDSACAVGLARIANGRVESTMHLLIRPPRKRIVFTHIHGITWKMVEEEKTFAESWPLIADFVGDSAAFVAHNAPFDRRVLAACCDKAEIKIPALPFLCTLKGSRKILPTGSKGLDAVCQYFSLPLNHHNAESDATACAEIYLRLIGLGLTDRDMLSK